MLENIKNPYIRNTLLALFVALVGFVLLNLTFLLYAAIVNGIGMLFPIDFARSSGWYMPVMMSIISLGVVVGYWFVFKSKLKEIYKATLMTVPTAVVLVVVGVAFFRWPVIAYSIGVALTAGTLFYFYKTKQPWLYWFAVIIVAVALLAMNLTSVEI
jgi:hypothetical protein